MNPTVKDLVARHVAPVLRDAGYRKVRFNFRRTLEEVSHVFSVQSSRFRDKDTPSITLNVGVLVPGVREVYGAVKLSSNIDAAHCCIQFRIGMLPYMGGDAWWDLDAKSQAINNAAGEEISSAIRNIGLPFLNEFQTALSVAKYLEEAGSKDRFFPVAKIQRWTRAAVIYALNDRWEKARHLFDAAQARQAAKKRPLGRPVEEIARRTEARLSTSRSAGLFR